jgi:SAM-dependent methyltransferase
MRALSETDAGIDLPQLPLEPDLFGQVLRDYVEGRSTEYFLRRDDNLLERDESARYFRTWEAMPAHQRCLLKHAQGRVLDLGAGAGQHALALQARGLEVVAVDSSPLAVEVMRHRGVADARLMDARMPEFAPASVDTALLMSGNLGLAGDMDGLHALLTRLHAIIRPGGQVLCDIPDYTATHNPAHLAYHRMNTARGRYPGSLRLRVEHEGAMGPTFDWLLTTLADLRAVCAETGWRMHRVVQVDKGGLFAVGLARM